jgi:hypothetical protein
VVLITAFDDVALEVSIGYPESPLNGPSFGRAKGPRPGERVVPVNGQIPIGAGDTPRFALFAERSAAVTDFLQRFEELLDPELRHPFDADGMTLVRPDGYVACSAKETSKIADYLTGLFGKQ